MLKQNSPVYAGVLLLLALGSSATAQRNLSPAPNSFQPAKASAAATPSPAPAMPAAPAVSAAPADTDRVRDGLLGPVRRVRTETAKLTNKNGALLEQPRVLLEIAAYDLKGTKIESAYFPVSGEALTGKEVYKYDEKGNISEMTLQSEDGSLLSKETYTYEYDMLGNWTKMSTAIAVVAGGKLSFEPVEVTYRTITYYLDANIAKLVQPAQPAPNPNAASPAASNAPPSVALPAAVSLDKSRIMPGADALREPASNAASHPNAPAVLMNSEPPAVPAPKPLLKPVSGGVLNGKAISLPKPLFPEAAKNMRGESLVNVEVVIDETGKVVNARATSGPMLLRDACVQAAQRARFSPTKISGQPVKVAGNITYTFNLAQ